MLIQIFHSFQDKSTIILRTAGSTRTQRIDGLKLREM